MKDLSQGFIALFRQFLKWEWFTDVNTCHFFQYCLLRANPRTVTWRGQKIKRGQFISSLDKMSKETGLTSMQIRTCINKLVKTGEITNESTTQNRVITVKNYNEYQSNNKRVTNVLTNVLTNGNPNGTKQNLEPITNEITSKLTTNNNIDNNNNIYNISLYNREKISQKEREILNNYVKRKKLAKTSVRAYVNAIIKSGDYIDILKEEEQRIEKIEAKKEQAQEIEPVLVSTENEEENLKAFENFKRSKEKLKKEIENDKI